MKRFCLAGVLFLGLCLLSGCGESEYADIGEAIRIGAVLGENIVINDIDVSGMGVAEARRKLMAAQEAYLAQLQYEIHAGADTVHINALELGTYTDLDDVLMDALKVTRYYPGRNPARSFSTSIIIDEQRVMQQAENIAAVLYVAPVNASAQYDRAAEGYFTYTEGQDGRRLDAACLGDQLLVALQAESSASIEASVDAVPAEYTTEQARADTQLIAAFSTSFAGSTYSRSNRVYNIEKAASMIDGTVVAPGEEFDMNAILGPRNEKNGWKEATGIRDGAYVQEYGGGVCQVSSTLYNAVLMADLTVTDRTHHSWPLGYIDIGRDATISTGGPNFKFQNTQPVPITVSAATDTKNKTVSVSIYGRPLADGMTIRISSQKVETLESPGVEYVKDNTLAPGTETVVRKPRTGSVSMTYKEYYDAQGNLLRKEQVTRDKYRSIKGITHVGPGVSAAMAGIAGEQAQPGD